MATERFELPAIPPWQARLILAVTLSLALHLAVFFLVRVVPAPRPPTQVKVLDVKLAEVIRHDAPLVGVVLDSPRALRRVNRPILNEPQEMPPDSESGGLPHGDAPQLDAPQPVAPPKSLLPAVNMDLLSDPTYYSAREVDVHPQAAQPVRPVYPESAALKEMEGRVVLTLLIEDDGSVREVSVVESDPPGVFDEAALAAFRAARFVPAQRNGRVVKSRMTIEVTFAIDKAKPDKP